MENTIKPLINQDLLGFQQLHEIAKNILNMDKSHPMPNELKEQLINFSYAMDAVQTKYELLCDRYTLLKRSNAQLSNELIWLRDQCDDLASIASSTETEKLSFDPDEYSQD